MRYLAVALLLSLTACAVGPARVAEDKPLHTVELANTPFFAQTQYQCGPAALATVLVSDGVAVTPEQLIPQVYVPELRGSLQEEMIAATRRYDRVPYLLNPSLNSILTEVAAGTPVLVMQNLLLRIWPKWHYAVVVGYDSDSDSILLRSGTKERLSMKRVRFEATWNRADSWAMVAVEPHAIPATANPNNWLRAVSAFEELGRADIARTAYESAVMAWPDHALSWQALANAKYAMGDLIGAESALREALIHQPSAGGYNNLAHVLYRLGCLSEAKDQITLAEQMEDATAMMAIIASTRLAIEVGAADSALTCALPAQAQ